MSVFDQVALAAAERVGASLGASAGLRALMPLVDTVPDGLPRARALTGALRFAIELDRQGTICDLATRWRRLTGPYFVEIAACCRALMRTKRPALALELADAEVARSPEDGRAAYLRARCASPTPVEDLHRALRLARRPPHQRDLEVAAATRLARLGVDIGLDDVGHLPARDQLALAATRLHARGRYRRLSALDTLEGLASSKDAQVASYAMRLAAGHADIETRLTDIERDRIGSIVQKWPDPLQRDTALGRLHRTDLPADVERAEASRRADAVLQRASAGPAPQPPTLDWRAQRVIAAYLREDHERADSLASLLDHWREHKEQPIGNPVLTAAWLASRDQDESSALIGNQLAELAVQAPMPLPRRGWVRLAAVVSDAVVIEKLLLKGQAVRELGAAEEVAQAALRAAWVHYKRDEASATLAALRRAKALFKTL